MSFFVFLIALGVAVDQLIKLKVILHLKPIRTLEVIPGVFNLTYVENTGAAFSAFSGNTYVLTIVAIAVTAAIAFYMFGNLKRGDGIRMRNCGKIDTLWTLNVAISLIISGSTGNTIDRIRLGYVVDFLDFIIIKFPVFNVADCLIVTGTFMAIISIFTMREGTRV